MALQKQVRFSSQIDIILPMEYTEQLPETQSNSSSISDDSSDSLSTHMVIQQKCRRTSKKADGSSLSSSLGIRPKATKESILGDLSRYTLEAYICPFCSSNSQTYTDQLTHLEIAHPWYSLDIHRTMR
ncbi:hypothetical protein GGH99_002993 [Coemansia sp. RSA 1285]|nr:hypothetical protein EV177_004025 [Coemansia sp. RSA 1804]KAJ2688673.1 hypothetical protein GGH99_002993 [Coemansia sp. RSA 1285]